MEHQRDGSEAAADRLRLLRDQADSVRAELAQLRADLAATRNEFSKLRATELAKTSETLVIAAAHADTVAQSAVSSLDELNLYGQRDELTGLPTRALMLDRLETMISAAERAGSRIGVVFLDLDGFKQINDTLGHAVGDQVLQIATRQMLSALRESDTVSRHGGDEFILLFPQVSRAGDLAPVADKILAALKQPMRIGGHDVRVSASIGIAVFPEDGTTSSALLGNADAAMYQSKKQGRGRYMFHAPSSESAPIPLDRATVVPLSRRADPGFTEHEARLRALREANQRLLEAALNDQTMRAHAERAHQHQIDFVAMAAHAMRTPLSVITATASLMKRAPSEADSPQRIEILQKHGKHLARLIDDLLDGSMVGGGKFKLAPTELPLDAVLDSAVEAARYELASRRQTLNLTRHQPPTALRGDAMRITQIFANLLKNASRRAPDGGDIWFSADVDGSQAVFVVADAGAAMSDESLEGIFELYAIDKSHAAHDAGLGIGLAVARELVRAHGGSILARNSANRRRVEFVVTLPLATAALTDPPPAG